MIGYYFREKNNSKSKKNLALSFPKSTNLETKGNLFRPAPKSSSYIQS